MHFPTIIFSMPLESTNAKPSPKKLQWLHGARQDAREQEFLQETEKLVRKGETEAEVRASAYDLSTCKISEHRYLFLKFDIFCAGVSQNDRYIAEKSEWRNRKSRQWQKGTRWMDKEEQRVPQRAKAWECQCSPQISSRWAQDWVPFFVAQEKKLSEKTAHLEAQLQEVKTSRPDARDPRKNQDTSPSRLRCHSFRDRVH